MSDQQSSPNLTPLHALLAGVGLSVAFGVRVAIRGESLQSPKFLFIAAVLILGGCLTGALAWAMRWRLGILASVLVVLAMGIGLAYMAVVLRERVWQ